MSGGILQPWVIIFWGVLVGALLAFSCSSKRQTTSPLSFGAQESWSKREVFFILFLLSLGLALRTYGLRDFPIEIHNDEASVGINAKKWLGSFRLPYLFGSSWAGLPEFSYLFSSLSMIVFGESLWGLRIGSAIWGTFSLLGIYLLTRLLFGKRAALFSLVLCVPFHWHVHLSRTGHHYIQNALVLPWGLYLFLKGIREKRFEISVLVGIFTGFAVHMYFASRLIPIIQIFLLLFILIKEPKERNAILYCSAAWGVSLLIFILPSIYFYLYHLPEFAIRSKQVSISFVGNSNHINGYVGSSSWPKIMLYQISNAFGILFFRGDSSVQYGRVVPFINPILYIPFVTSLIVALKHIGSVKWFTIFFTLLLTIFFGGILTIDPPFSPRLSGLSSILPIFVGAFFAQIADKFKGSLLLIFILIISAGASDLYWYKTKYLEVRSGTRRDQIARMLDVDKSIYQVVNLFPEKELSGYESYKFLAKGVIFQEAFGEDIKVLLETVRGKRSLIVSPDPISTEIPLEKSELISIPNRFFVGITSNNTSLPR